MYKKKTQIKNTTGLHARPASDFVMKAKTYMSKVFIQNIDEPDSEPVNAKSIMRILAEGMSYGTHVEVSADGVDETTAVDQLVALIDSFRE